MVEDNPLAPRMRELADTLQDPATAADLRQKADALEAAVAKYAYGGDEANMKRMVGAWARARRAWCNVTGEPLV